jgi:LD-carboxypeptidase C-terminal domain
MSQTLVCPVVGHEPCNQPTAPTRWSVLHQRGAMASFWPWKTPTNIPIYRVERKLLQLLPASMIVAQKAVLLGDFSDWSKSRFDNVCSIKSATEMLRRRTRTPILTGLPFGHGGTKFCLPVGERIDWCAGARGPAGLGLMRPSWHPDREYVLY